MNAEDLAEQAIDSLCYKEQPKFCPTCLKQVAKMPRVDLSDIYYCPYCHKVFA